MNVNFFREQWVNHVNTSIVAAKMAQEAAEAFQIYEAVLKILDALPLKKSSMRAFVIASYKAVANELIEITQAVADDTIAEKSYQAGLDVLAKLLALDIDIRAEVAKLRKFIWPDGTPISLQERCIDEETISLLKTPRNFQRFRENAQKNQVEKTA